MISCRRSKGFTLIELLVVISIIGLLSSIVLASLNTARSKARDARRISDMTQIGFALNLYYSVNNAWPELGNTQSGDWPTAFKTALAPYISKLPIDPILNQGAPGWQFYGFVKCDWTTTHLLGDGIGNNCWWLNYPQTGQFCPGKYVLFSYNSEGQVKHNDCGPNANPNAINFIISDW